MSGTTHSGTSPKPWTFQQILEIHVMMVLFRIRIDSRPTNSVLQSHFATNSRFGVFSRQFRPIRFNWIGVVERPLISWPRSALVRTRIPLHNVFGIQCRICTIRIVLGLLIDSELTIVQNTINQRHLTGIHHTARYETSCKNLYINQMFECPAVKMSNRLLSADPVLISYINNW